MRGLGCNTKMSNDDKIVSFVLNYISNLIKVFKQFNEKITVDDFERMLLSNDMF